MTTECTCDDWKEGMAQINGAQVMSVLHHGAQYTAPKFRFCPWCGDELFEEMEWDKKDVCPNEIHEIFYPYLVDGECPECGYNADNIDK